MKLPDDIIHIIDENLQSGGLGESPSYESVRREIDVAQHMRFDFIYMIVSRRLSRSQQPELSGRRISRPEQLRRLQVSCMRCESIHYFGLIEILQANVSQSLLSRTNFETYSECNFFSVIFDIFSHFQT